jgi:UDP-2-acetamido-2-deoxy-ribo-hexuluronate aminotransferase
VGASGRLSEKNFHFKVDAAMEFIDIKAQQAIVIDRVDENIRQVLSHGGYILGPEVQDLEEKLSDYVGSQYCIGVSSGSDALLISMMALGIGAGDEVITTPFTFVATAEMVCLLGAKPVFVDIDPQTYNIDPYMLEAAITDKTRLILPVSLYGQCAELNTINSIAGKYNLPVLEDAAQSFGATHHGIKSCGITTLACTSFFPSKPLGGYGDGGAIFTNDTGMAQKIRQIRVHGQDRRYHHARVGINGRLDTIQAAILLAKFEIFPDEVSKRDEIGVRYTELLAAHSSEVTVPYIAPWNKSVYAQYTILIDEREKVADRLQQAGIPTAIHYPTPLHQQPAFATDEFYLPVTESVSKRVLSLPMHPYLSAAEQEEIDRLL